MGKTCCGIEIESLEQGSSLYIINRRGDVCFMSIKPFCILIFYKAYAKHIEGF